MERGQPHSGGTSGDSGAAASGEARRSRALALAMVGLTPAAYALLFPALHRVLGEMAPIASVTIPVLAGALLGWRWGATLGFLCMPLNVLLLAWVGDTRISPGAHATAAIAYLAIGAVIGRLREVAIELRRTQADQMNGVLAGARQTRRTLAERDAQVEQAQAIAHVGYWAVDLESAEVTWSTELFQIMGDDPETLRPSSETWWRRVHPEDRAKLERTAERAKVEEVTTQDEFRLVRADGKIRWVYGRVQALRDESGRPIKLLGTLQDVTEQKELHAQLAAAERLATVGTLAAGVAHEINNPLSSVISNLEFVLEDLRRQPPQQRGRAQALEAAAGEALQGADRVSCIVRDLMAFSRPRGEAGPVDVERVLDLSLSMAATQTRYRARLVKEYGRVPPASGDASRLGQVFLNLLVNAAQAIPAGHPENQEIRVSSRLEGDRIVVSIHDTGAGMTPEVRNRIFEPFFTTKPVGSGMGLGLSTSLAAVRAMGGDIVAESEPGGGSTFVVTLPALAAVHVPEPLLTPLPAAPRGEAPAPAPDRRGRILIIDHEPREAAQVARELAAEHEVRHAADGRAGLEEISSAGPFDAVLCDLEMPGLSGMEVHEAVRRRDPELAARMIFLIDGEFTAAARAFLAAKRNRVMAKPVAAEALRKLLRHEPRRG